MSVMSDYAVVSEIDELTGVASRHAALHELDSLLAQSPALECLVIDIDNFDGLNAHLGSSVADEILVRVASSIADTLPGFTVGRLGGDQFMAFGLRPTTDLERSTLTVLAVETCAGVQTVQLSAGLSSTAVSGLDADSLLRDALGALRIAKRDGKQRLIIADADLRSEEIARRRIARDVRVALEGNELEAWAQPIHDITTMRPAGFELLARWPQGDNAVSPGLFVPVIESLGFSFLLGEFMVREAISLLARLQDEGHHDTFVTMNLSAKHVAEPLLESLIAVQMQRQGIRPDRLIVELTESQQLPDTVAGRTAIERLRSLGIGVATDDLGAGWSSLTQMIQSPFTHVKTDRSLIEATSQPGGTELIRAIRLLAEGAGQTAIAEGIETEVELEAAKQAGYVLGQGWLMSRPAPIEAALLSLDEL